LDAYPNEGAGIIFTYVNNARSVTAKLRAAITARTVDSVVRQYTVAGGELEKRVNDREVEYNEGTGLMDGIRQELEGMGEYLAKYPAEGLVILNRMAGNIVADVEQGRAFLAQYRNESPELTGSPEVERLYVFIQSQMDRLEKFRSQGLAAAAAARTQISRAESLRLDGDRLIREAESAVARNDFDVARDRVIRATERYNASLAIQESATLRREWDTRLVALGAEIKKIENEIIVREVRTLVNNARNTYFAGNFERAEELLVRAENRWKITNGEEDSEIRYWLNVVRGALSLRSGRIIPSTAPLYAEMSQLLSDAKKNYDEGVRLINSRRRGEGIAKFDEARQKTQEVKLMFPVNQEARLLELRMDQVTDPQAFNESFARRFNEAVAGTKPNQRSVESFAELQNLAQINPRYPGIRNAISQAEIDMGYRPPPPDPRALARSNELTREARRIIDANIRAQLPVALEQLNQALILNPNNTEAMYEKDRVQTLIGGEGSVIADSVTERRYQEAVLALQQGNNLTAMAIVQQLLQEPKNQNNPRIMELRRRIESIL
jgi:hypothetical protein